MAIIKSLIFLFLFLFLLTGFAASPAFAGSPNPQCPGGETDSQGKCLDTCNTARYCDKETNKWMDKKCDRSVDYRSSESMRELDPNTALICVCTYQITRESCDTPGGVPRTTNTVEGIFGQIKPPNELSNIGIGAKGINNILQRIIQLIYIVGSVGFVLVFLWNALQLIISGADKEKVAGARKHITWAVIGITFLALAFPLLRVLESVIGMKLLF